MRHDKSCENHLLQTQSLTKVNSLMCFCLVAAGVTCVVMSMSRHRCLDSAMVKTQRPVLATRLQCLHMTLSVSHGRYNFREMYTGMSADINNSFKCSMSFLCSCLIFVIWNTKLEHICSNCNLYLSNCVCWFTVHFLSG